MTDWREEALLAQRKHRGEVQGARLTKAQKLIADRFNLELEVYLSLDDDEYGYATLQREDGALSAYYLSPTDYGILSIGQTCTFQVSGAVAKSVSCAKAGQ